MALDGEAFDREGIRGVASTDSSDALLLIGPTGSGKTPLGEWLETRGIGDHRCLHFDFGENLRRAVGRNQPDEIITQDDVDYLRDVLRRGVLLEDRDFPIAERILLSFLAGRHATADTCIVLNGLPRHQGQSRDLEHLLDIRTVVHLQCSAETVLERLVADTGGDRFHRTDDDLDAVQHKLRIFAEQTEPLIDHYRQRAARVICIDVTAAMTPEQMWLVLQAAFNPRQ
jgi:adenylate kinase family enzyme